MDVANPWMQKSCWDEWKRLIEEDKRRRLLWMQRVMRWTGQELERTEAQDDEDDSAEDIFKEFLEQNNENQAEILHDNVFENEHLDDEVDNDESLDNRKHEEDYENFGEVDTESFGDDMEHYFKENGDGGQDIEERSENAKFDDLSLGSLEDVEVVGVQTQGEEEISEVLEEDDNNLGDLAMGGVEEVEVKPGIDVQNIGVQIEEKVNWEDDDDDYDQCSEHGQPEFDLGQNSDPLGSLEDNEVKTNYSVQIPGEEEIGEQVLEDDDNNLGDLAMGGIEEFEVKLGIDVKNIEVQIEETDNWEDDEDDYDQSYEHEQEILSNYSEFYCSSQNSVSTEYDNGELYFEETYNQNTPFDDKEVKELNYFEDLLDQNDNSGTKTPTEQVEEPVAKNLTTKELQDVPQTEEVSTDDDEGEFFGDEEADCYDPNEIQIYNRDNHSNEVFNTLKEFRDALILIDLELQTVDETCFHVHSIVLAAVSYLALKFLNEKQKWDRKTQLVKLGKEVADVGLEAVIEFAYTGAVACLNNDNVDAIKKAAIYLGAPRVTEVCERQFPKRGQKKKDPVPASEQLRVNLETIEELWSTKKGCDITLDVISASFQVHKVILAACSDYFRAMFTLGMKESSQSTVFLRFLTAPELKALISCSYSGSVSLSWNCVFETTITALQLQFQSALDLCLQFLHKEINPYSCLDLASFAEAFGMVQLLEFAEDYVLRQFEKVARTAKFKDLPGKNLLKYLNSFALCVPSELVVFRAVVTWIQAKPKRRLRLAKELMKTIHFPLMTFKEFSEVRALKIWSDHSLQELYDAIFEDFCSNEAELQNQCRIYLPKESLVLSGGDQISEDFGNRSISKDLWFGNSLRNHMGIIKAMEWRKLGEMPQPARFSHEVAVFKGQLYVVGGKKYYGIDDTLSSVLRYDPLKNSWEELASMNQRRCSFSLVVLDAKLYAIGGHCHPDYIESVERYCPTANSWSFTCPLDLPLGGHVARELQGQIFVSGGLNSDYECLSSIFAYDPEKGCTYLENMARPRAHHCMEVLGNCLYVAGGLSHCANAGIVDLLTCEMYNPAADSWTTFQPLPVPHVGSGSAVLEGKFYVLGGYCQLDYSDINMVHRYNPATQQWENMGKMPGPNNDIRACVLGLPEHLRLSPD